MTDYSQKVRELFDDQFRDWALARDNYRQLDDVMVRNVTFPGYKISVQFNPGRITSSAARVDAKSIEARPCFLCEKNRPAEQRGIPLEGDYIILINPFPIFRRHLTIVSGSHTPQRIAGNFGTMLALARSLPEYVVFYNGPQCGASAPDHLHFQAGNRGFLPIEKDVANPHLCQRTEQAGNTELWHWSGYGRGIMTLMGSDSRELEAAFNRFLKRFGLARPGRPEPMVNILAYHDKGSWTVHFIPRKVHRPSCYFAEGDERILLSPASVDLGGVFITPRGEDFNKIKPEHIRTILDEVCLGEDELKNLTRNIL
ncbi:MAG: DUF4922 domain-containing protein [Bacteroidota bacterium]|nr:DUF4922 domain-containing protein [Bacteroidota bacterium]